MSTFIKDPNFNYTPYTLIYDEPIKETLNNADWKVTLVSIDDSSTLTFSPSFEEIGLDFTVININNVTWISSSDSTPFYELDDTKITIIDNTEKSYLQLSSNDVLRLSDLGILFYKFQNTNSIGGLLTINFTQIG